MKSKQAIMLIAVGIAVVILIGAGILILARNNDDGTEGLHVVTTFYPLHFLASQIGGDRASISMLIPENIEPHVWEPKVSDILKVDRSDIFIYNGGGFEPWVKDFIGSSQNNDLLIVDTSENVGLQMSAEVMEMIGDVEEHLSEGPFENVQATAAESSAPAIGPANTCRNVTLHAGSGLRKGYIKLHSEEDAEYIVATATTVSFTITSNGVALEPEMSIDPSSQYPGVAILRVFDMEPGDFIISISSTSAGTFGFVFMEKHHDEGGDEHEHGHGLNDPHFWLDPVLAMVQVDNIAKGFSEADPEHAVEYASNAVSLKDRLNKLDSDFKEGLKDRKKNDIITTHEGFNYLAKRYGFETRSAIGISGDEQPSINDIANLVRMIEEKDLGYIFVEPVYSDQYMETVSDETGADILILDGLHGRMGAHADMDYFEIMYENLRNLRIGLEAE
ncbi:MAG: metal ABC transporter substrate-binding protein [Candidatus Thermoplasmatota archaeon]|jgi:zinc transport system substrate-binding protein|nr:metal ABC transporter substrate-binding protein [Candidatus Thermoplasmatota archaeon]